MSANSVVPQGLTARQFKGLLRLGDVCIPGDGDLPSFSDSGCAPAIERMLPFMYDADRTALLALLGACARLPTAVIRGIVAAGSHADGTPEVLAGPLRMANIGIKGVVMSLYWSDVGTGSVWKTIGYAAHVTSRDPEPNSPETEPGRTPSHRADEEQR